MDPILVGALIIVALLVVLGVVYAVRGAGGRAEFAPVIKSWRKVAASARLTFTAPETDLSQARLSGRFRKRDVAVSLRVHVAYLPNHDKKSVIYTQVQASTTNPLKHFMRFSTKGAYRKTDRYLGAPYESVDDAELDRRFGVKCIPPGIAARAVAASPEFRKQLLAVKTGTYVELEVEGAEIRFEQEGLIHDADYLLALLELIDSCGLVVEKVQ